MIRTPRKAWPIWILTNASLVALPLLADAWYSRIERASSLSPDASTGGDSFGIPLLSLIILVLLALPIAYLALRFLLRPYPGAVSLLPSMRRRWHLVLLDVVVAICFGACVYATVLLVSDRDLEFVPVTLTWCYLLLAIRATVHGRAN